VRRIAVMIVVVSAALGAGVASAQRENIETNIEIHGYGFPDGAHADGQILAEKAKCLPNRTVKIFALTAAGPELFDQDKTSDNGYWGGDGAVAEKPSGVRAKVLAKEVGDDKCTQATDDAILPPRADQGPERARAARQATYDSWVDIAAATIGLKFVHAEGQVLSQKAKCFANRPVKISAITESGNVQVDADKASDNGHWGGEGPAQDPIGVKAKAPAKTVGGDKCASASEQITAP
jgi:hypothetical protein